MTHEWITDLPSYVRLLVPNVEFEAMFDVGEKMNISVVRFVEEGEPYETLEGVKGVVPIGKVQVEVPRKDLTRFWREVAKEVSKVFVPSK